MLELARWSRGYPAQFPAPLAGNGTWYCKVPVPQHVVDGTNARRRARKECMQYVLDAAARLRRIRPPEVSHARVVALISLPKLFNCSTDVFFDEQVWERFTDRRAPHHWWTPLPPSRSVLRACGLTCGPTDAERGFSVHVRDEDESSDSELWLVGDVE